MSQDKSDMNFFSHVEEPSKVTLEQMNILTEEILKLREKKENLETELKDLNGTISQRECQMIQFLKESGLKSFSNKAGNFIVNKRVTVNQPTDREAFINYLKDRGHFDEMISFNSQKLTSYVKAEIEEHARLGQATWLPPGITKLNEFETLSVRKGK